MLAFGAEGILSPRIAYLLRHALPLLGNNFKTDADVLLPYLALGALRRETSLV